MPAAPIPPDDDQRIEALQRCSILDTEPEADFDDLTSLAARLCDAPIALVSLVDRNRQWFKSARGVDVRETPRDWAFCGYAVYQRAPFVVSDAAADPRTSDNPLVTGEPHIRFYAGVPMFSDDGYALGTLCIIDTKPRSITAEQLNLLQHLARVASSLVACREPSPA